jgi:hypothetical protein
VPLLPAICDQCGQLFMPMAFRIEQSTNIRIENFSVGPCPHCGGMGHIPDGIYDVTAEGIRVLVTSAKSAASLERLGVLLQEAKSRNASGAEVADAIERDVPEFAPLATFLRGLGRPEIVIALITLLVMLITFLRADSQSGAQLDAIKAQTQATQAQTEELERIQSAIVAQLPTAQPFGAEAPATRPASPDLGRNDPCWCGSGLKYKRCHGR